MDDYSKLIKENSKLLKVLYVEDDENLRTNTADLLGLYFDHLDLCVDGEAGLNKYKTFKKEIIDGYDIVVSDIQMPKMNGIEMCERIKEIDPNQVIIFITAFTDVNYLLKAISLGADDYIAKPLELENFKKTLYRTTQKVNDNKLLKQYYDQLESKAIMLVDQKDSTSYHSAKDIYLDLQNNKENISKIWTANSTVHERLGKHLIDVEFFRTHYAIKVIEFLLKVINEEEVVGNCPVIFKMLEFFKNKHLPLEDIFMICVLFKNTVTEFIFKKYTFNHDVFIDISTMIDKNFEGVIINYLSMNYTQSNSLNPETKEVNKENNSNNTLEEKITQKKEYVNYAEYVLEHDLYVLEDLEEDIDTTAIAITGSDDSKIEDYINLGTQIKKYGEVLSNYPLFISLGEYVIKLGYNFSKNAQLLYDDKERMLNIASLIEGFVNDLIIWRREVFTNNIENPHFLNDSFFSNVDTIIMFIEYDESAASSHEEDFDDMFF